MNLNQSAKEKEILSPLRAADIIGVSERTLKKMREEGIGPKYLKVSTRKIRYRSGDIFEWLESRVIGNGD